MAKFKVEIPHKPIYSPKEIQKILDQTDWEKHRDEVNWQMNMPDCHFYDGEWAQREKRICPNWQYWLNEGREFHEKGEKGLTEYLRELQGIFPEGFRKMDHQRAEEFLKAKR